jgi:predicted GIY-YIG superfamily endonuclease
MNETELTETLDRRGELADARGPGVYALEVAIPHHGEQIARYWHRYHDHAPSDEFYTRLADADSVLYVGAADPVYDRLCDHVAGDVRKAAFLEAFPPESLHSLWPKESADAAFANEFNVANSLARVDRRVWTDGRLL